MSTLYLTQQDSVLRKEDERLKVTLKGETLLDLPMLKVSEVVVMGRVTVTPHTVAALMERNVHLTYLTEHGRYIGRIEPAFSKNSLLRRAQYAASFDEHRTLSLARGFVLGKLANLRVTLLRAARNTEDLDVDNTVEAIRGAERRAERAEELDILRGHEGEGSAAYFGVFDRLIKAEGFSFSKRVRRPPTDPVNALLSFGYALLANDIHAAVQTLGFDPYCGYLHADRYGRPSLALDLMEEFRPLIVDAVVLGCLNKRVLQTEDFVESLGHVCSLTPAGRKKFLVQYEERKQTEIQHPVFEYKATYQRCFELQARILAKCIQGELECYTPFVVR
ncbi:MAG: type I-D CRISPR-associated endonuclease Cas1 [Deltaproteobacteria bacterium]|nr:type I-D CRISPR-associated endonuclease Cas1 [Deltaproteobacteria bacterium]